MLTLPLRMECTSSGYRICRKTYSFAYIIFYIKTNNLPFNHLFGKTETYLL